MFFGCKIWEINGMEICDWILFDFNIFVDDDTMLFDEIIDVILIEENLWDLFELLYFYLW